MAQHTKVKYNVFLTFLEKLYFLYPLRYNKMLQENRKENMKVKLSRASKDLILLVAIVFLVLILSYFFDAFIIIVKFLQKRPEKIVYVDEVITSLLALSIGLAVFAWRRWLELKKETAERIKKQEELLGLTATQAEVERIINKQLHCDMDLMKQDMQEIIRLLHDRQKRIV